ncbi:GlyGly-CTERM sorting domain-containing protein [Photobacterium rosenbergii]|uniref:GlyGly-CTERM sorting domain-containing protein n=1 Tax=Photobacterium rosenbergii TaxID=294936 RepID=A0A2T3NKD3_9GAMM|nr:serine protease [Photobacterium rosenbergii]PSW15939.1 GlyGly-CTERM sorting domain-containing protein [Photobacterium rosenbergii]
MNKTLAPIALLLASTASFSSLADTAQVQTRVLNGQDATTLSENLIAPWQASMLAESDSSDYSAAMSACGAVIISEFWAVTAAHCVVKHDLTPVAFIGNTLIAGTNIIKNTTQDAKNIDPRFKFTIVEKIYHKGYVGAEEPIFKADNDIALLRVNRSFLENGLAKPIKIATPEEQTAINQEFQNTWNTGAYSKANLIASGWGSSEPEYKTPNNLRIVKLGGIPISQCNTGYQFDPQQSHFVCADSNSPAIKKDVCGGDSGGPLVWQNPNNLSDSDLGLRVIGVTSNGPTCKLKQEGLAGAQQNGLYTELSSYYKWIEANTDLNLSEVQTSTFTVDPFKVVKEDKPDSKGNEGTSTQSGSNKGGSGGGSLPLSGLVSLAALALLRRNYK